ncbi:hypothetical protein GW764_01325 [Candidatus Parcubacteria bacterium]|nr:hypothetical protein [Candidatus Parcubacteria bacterium]
MAEEPLNKKKGKRLRYKFKFPPNQNIVCIQTSIYFGKDFISVGGDLFGLLGEEAEKPVIIERINYLDGVEGVHTHNHEISVTKGEVFDWDEILPAIEALLGLELNESDEEPQKLPDEVHLPNTDPYGMRCRPFDGFM